MSVTKRVHIRRMDNEVQPIPQWVTLKMSNKEQEKCPLSLLSVQRDRFFWGGEGKQT